ncbi:MAG TPA: methyltransferase [Candidatus Nanoarchaeia archaeon]|nr:methyltransferase [Candidatus Nanoarchaeia archaeon]
MTRLSLSRGFKLYFSGVLIYGLGLLLIHYSGYQSLFALKSLTLQTLTYFYLAYLLFSPFYYFLLASDTESKPYIFLRWLKNSFHSCSLAWQKEERTAFLFLLVKLFFLPAMINFLFNNFNSVLPRIEMLPQFYWYPFFLTLLFAIDTLIFSVGYAFEFSSWKNKVKSVDPTLLGWLAAILCYPPFNWWLGRYIPWGANDYVFFWSPVLTSIFQIFLLFLLVVFVSATISLGLKSSNLTNRGIVTRFPYSIIRHPAYTSKTLIWWLTLLPVVTWPFALGMLFWTAIYYLRAVTEERHLGQDPEYKTYCQKVRYRFIPLIY